MPAVSEITKTCIKCGIAKSISLFNKCPKNTVIYYTNKCRGCISKEQWDKRKKFLDSYRSGACLDCGNTFPPECMDFDHLRDKKFEISQDGHNKSYKDVLQEIAKCEIVCGNCHALRTAKRRNKNQKRNNTKIKNILDNIKRSTPCVDCGKLYDSRQMQFDHVPEKGIKLFQSSKEVAFKNIIDVIRELKKCELVCVCCHRIRTTMRARV